MQIKLFKKEKNFQNKKESFWLDINLYWKFAVCFIFLVAVGAYFFGYYLFVKINEESDFGVTADKGQTQTVKKERIDKVLQYFSEREKKSAEILNSPAPIIDPSL